MKLKKLGEAEDIDGEELDENLVFSEGLFLRWVLIAMTAVSIHEGHAEGLLFPLMFSIQVRHQSKRI